MARDEQAKGNAARADLSADAEDARVRAEEAEEALAFAEETAAEAREADGAARAALAEAEGTAKALAGEAAGLERLLARPRDAKAEIVDSVRAAPGYEAAFGAALAKDLTLPEGEEGTGWRALPPYDAAAPLPDGAEPLSAYVAGPAALARRLAAVGVVSRADGERGWRSLAQGQRLVSREGDLWRWDGLVVAAGAAPSAAAERLRQRNRLSEVEAARAEAEAALVAARAAQARSAAALVAATGAEATARAARKAAEQAASETARALGRAETAAEALDGRVAGLGAGVERRARELSEARAALVGAEAAAAGVGDPAVAKAAVEAERMKVEAARLAMLTRRAQADEIERAGAARARRLAEISRDAEDWRNRRASATARLAGLDRLAAGVDEELAAARDLPEALAARGEDLEGAADEAEARRRAAAGALALAEATLRDRDAAARSTERRAGEAREALARADAMAESAAARVGVEAERLEAETGQAPADLLAGLGVDAATIAPAAELESEVARLRRARDGLGAVNLRAEEDAKEIQAEFDQLTAERADLEEAIKKLRVGIAGLNREGRGRLLAAFDTVNRNFTTLFKHLFGGGEASLVLVESEDPLEAGLEIMCQPPGKKLSTLSLLSGGEQTLTALSLIFAVFLANPSPICVLDEVDAPLDDANVVRFCDLLDEMIERTETRFLVITHHAVTMGRMDRLYGVTMQEPGVSQLVSVDLAAAERMVEPIG